VIFPSGVCHLSVVLLIFAQKVTYYDKSKSLVEFWTFSFHAIVQKCISGDVEFSVTGILTISCTLIFTGLKDGSYCIFLVMSFEVKWLKTLWLKLWICVFNRLWCLLQCAISVLVSTKTLAGSLFWSVCSKTWLLLLLLYMSIIMVALSHYCCRTTLQCQWQNSHNSIWRLNGNFFCHTLFC